MTTGSSKGGRVTLLERLRELPRTMRAAVLLAAAGAGGLAFAVSGGSWVGMRAPGRTPEVPHVAPEPGQAEPCAGGHGDILDRLRASHTPALEREILETARAAVASAVSGGEGAGLEKDPTAPEGDSTAQDSLDGSVLETPAGVFVALILDGSVRGCMGTVYPMEASLVEEIASAARMAATSDPRRPPIRPEEVPRLDYCVSVVGRLRRHEPGAPVDPRTQGVIVRANGRAGVILPGEARTGAYEIAWAKREAGAGPGDRFELLVFETERFGKALPLRR